MNQTATGGIGFCGALTVAFIVLKLTSVIYWSWIWVLAPIWMLILLVIFVLLLMIGIGAIVVLTEKKMYVIRRKVGHDFTYFNFGEDKAENPWLPMKSEETIIRLKPDGKRYMAYLAKCTEDGNELLEVKLGPYGVVYVP